MTILDSSPPTSASREKDCAELLTSIARGDRDAFAELYDILAPSIFATVSRQITDATRAEKVMHEVFLEVWRHAPRLRRAGISPREWVHEVAHLRCGSIAA